MSINKKGMVKKIGIFGIIVIVSIIAVVLVLNNKDKGIESESITEIDVTNSISKGIEEVFDVSESDSSKYNVETITSKGENVASKYKSNSTVEVANANIELRDIKGKVIYTNDGQDDIAVFQTKYKIEEKDDMPPAIEVNLYMQEFKDKCISYLDLEPDAEPKEEKLYGEDTTDAPIPVEESIYYENRLYSLTYESDKTMYSREEQNEMVEETKKDGTVELVEKKAERKTKSYDINFYMLNGYLVCEFVTR